MRDYYLLITYAASDSNGGLPVTTVPETVSGAANASDETGTSVTELTSEATTPQETEESVSTTTTSETTVETTAETSYEPFQTDAPVTTVAEVTTEAATTDMDVVVTNAAKNPVDTTDADTDAAEQSVFSGDQTLETLNSGDAAIVTLPTVGSGEDSLKSDGKGLPGGIWLAIGIVIGVIIGVIAALVSKRRRPTEVVESGSDVPMTEAPSISQTSLNISVDKLHEMGKREYQQDCFSVTPVNAYSSLGVLVTVADGMGGLTDGDKISATAVKAVIDGFFESQGAPNAVLLDLLAKANRAVNAFLNNESTGRGGTTMIMGIIKDGMLSTLSVGDSRICLLRNGDLVQINRDHIYRNELSVHAVNGETTLNDVYTNKRASGLTSYVGMGNIKYVDTLPQPIKIHPGDKLIFMTDGVYNALNDQEITAALSADSGNISDALKSAIEAKCYPDQDNYTAVVITC